MADVTTYRRCTTAYAWGVFVFHPGEVRVSTDPAVVANPAFWVALTDTELTGGTRRLAA